MKYIFLILLVFFTYSSINAQVGINTTTPQEDLHVVGNIQITKELLVGGSSSTLGNAGSNNQVLTSGGEDQPAVWKDLNLNKEIPIGTLTLDLQAVKRNGFINGGVLNRALYNSATDYLFLNSKYLSSGSDGQYTVMKSGFYRLYASVTIEINDNNMTTAGWTKSSIKKINSSNTTSTLVGQTTFSSHGYTKNVGQTLSGIDYLNAGDKIWLEFARENKSTGHQYSFSIIYTGR